MEASGDLANANTSSEDPKIGRSSSTQEKLAQAKAKSKRVRSVSISEPQPTRSQPKLSKNSRRSRGGLGRGLPKKGGAGGKGVWGKPGSELEDPGSAVDSRDPNYDSDSMDDHVQLEPVPVELSADEIKKLAEGLVLEYFDHGDTGEVDGALTDNWDSINMHLRYLIVVTMIEVAMDHKASHRELTSVLLSDLYQECLTQTDISRGFEALLGSLSDLVLDCPEAPTVLGNFLARAVADDCLPPKYLTSHKGKVECRLAVQALDRADVLVNMRQGMVRLDSVWGVGGARRPVRSLVKQMTLLLEEFLTSGDTEEAIRCLKDLEVPHFHHELVYEAVTMAIERSDDKSIAEMVRLLKAMSDACVLSPNQMDEGFARVYENIPDIQLDVPNGHALMEKIVTLAFQGDIISSDTKRKMPARGRKRFVSEGDGGRIKERGDVFPLAY
ncbi:programmed cell death protein 4-like [Pollicipes pollicipes]|uniref:programmed cell death protein 4-like n=1 Tax=Pollicipes pollicipes TaxID=41117 RepID=UPI0018857F43|nr:programmed cell death protein 4-like [Pollicipes pollicipes]XP_037092003.1 programmed cell death protein 4-like [Pollicipes pollicipes]XP_037092004.1 programmed cell death protein 4-like [Pollicipes pollicipes]